MTDIDLDSIGVSDADDLSIPDDFQSNNDKPPLACLVCGTGLTYGGRGPYPKYCDEHKKSKPASSGGGGRKATGGATDKVIRELTELYVLFGTGISLINQNDGLLIGSSAPKLAESWRGVIDNDPRIKEAFQRLASSSGWAAVLSAHIPIGLGLMANHQEGLSHLWKPKNAGNSGDNVTHFRKTSRRPKQKPTPEPEPEPSPVVDHVEI